jgi:hypothetical protein
MRIERSQPTRRVGSDPVLKASGEAHTGRESWSRRGMVPENLAGQGEGSR